MFGNPIQAPNCQSWSEWGPCVWLRGNEKRFQRSYFEQLLPGRKGCRSHVFFRLLKDRWGTAFNNFYNYLREITLSEQQCGECSYQQSCGRSCHRRGDVQSINPLFVAERRCMGVDQNKVSFSSMAHTTVIPRVRHALHRDRFTLLLLELVFKKTGSILVEG
ncbi:unnamed protein product [Heligmosomoides polygyrus]|uniref:Radical SAM protein n=1 Tax=Heligmosomoides polygyrus TaxID=6339 RepID=A0A183G4P0_HELPZ|nr:unnamed protein product [Heligmosomoides polygyrus]